MAKSTILSACRLAAYPGKREGGRQFFRPWTGLEGKLCRSGLIGPSKTKGKANSLPSVSKKDAKRKGLSLCRSL